MLLSSGCTEAKAPCAGVRTSEVAGQAVTGADGTIVSAQRYEDPLVQLSRLDGSTFVEILEVQAVGDRVFFCSGVKGLNIVDVSTPTSMKTLARIGSSLGSTRYPRCQHLAVEADNVFISNRGDEIQSTSFVAAFDRDTGAELATYTEPDHSFEGLAAAGGYVFAAAHDQGLVVLKVGENSLTRVGGVGALGNAWNVAHDGEHAYVADSDGRLVIVNVADPTKPVVASVLEIGGSPQSVAIDESTQTAWVAAGSSGLIGVSIANPSTPLVVAEADTPATALQVALDDGHAFVADWNDVRAYDVSQPAAVALVSSERIDVPQGFSRVLGVGAANGTVFMGEWTGLYAYRFEPSVTPDIWAAERSIDFGAVPAGSTATAALILRNLGQAPLVAWDIATTDAAFSVSQTQLVLGPGEADAIEVSFSPGNDDEQRACLAVRSDDPDDQPLVIELGGNLPSLGVGDPAPDVEVQLVGGGTWRLDEQRGKVVVMAYFATF